MSTQHTPEAFPTPSDNVAEAGLINIPFPCHINWSMGWNNAKQTLKTHTEFGSLGPLINSWSRITSLPFSTQDTPKS